MKRCFLVVVLATCARGMEGGTGVEGTYMEGSDMGVDAGRLVVLCMCEDSCCCEDVEYIAAGRSGEGSVEDVKSGRMHESEEADNRCICVGWSAENCMGELGGGQGCWDCIT